MKVSWYKAVDGLNVVLGAGETRHIRTLRQYFDECWDPVKDMWTMYSRAMLPLGSEHTNNRIERAFRSMKDELKLRLSGRITISQAIPCLVDWAEGQLDDRYTAAQCQSISITDSDPHIAAMFKEAGQTLTYYACLKLKTAVDRLKEKSEMMRMLENGGVEEIWKVDDTNITKKYDTSSFDCNCTFHRQHRCPCSHMLFVRQTEGIALFDPALYSPQYLAVRQHDLLQDLPAQEDDDAEEDSLLKDIVVVDDVDEPFHVKQLTVSQKCNILFSKLQCLSNLICSYSGTDAFLHYVNEIDHIWQLMHQGQRNFDRQF